MTELHKTPPVWGVCPECGGRGDYDVVLNYADYHYGGEEPITEKTQCEHCHGTGQVEIRYTPQQWTEAGGILTDDTGIWVGIYEEDSDVFWTYYFYKQINYLPGKYNHPYIIIAHPEQERPAPDWRPTDEQ